MKKQNRIIQFAGHQGKPGIGSQLQRSWDENLGLIHYRAILGNPKNAIKILPWTHQLITNTKAVFSGPHRGVSRKHLQKYLSEVCYRFNRRFRDRETFDRLLTACVSTDTITRDEIIAVRS